MLHIPSLCNLLKNIKQLTYEFLLVILSRATITNIRLFLRKNKKKIAIKSNEIEKRMSKMNVGNIMSATGV